MDFQACWQKRAKPSSTDILRNLNKDRMMDKKHVIVQIYPTLHTLAYCGQTHLHKSGENLQIWWKISPEDRLLFTAQNIYQLPIVIASVTSSKKPHKTWGVFVYIHHVSSFLCTAKAEQNLLF